MSPTPIEAGSGAAGGVRAQGRAAAGPADLAALAAIGGIYAAQGLVGGLAFQGVPTVMRSAGAALNEVALAYLALLPWALKFLWAPWLERYRLPASGARRRSHRIVLPGQCLMAALALLSAVAALQAAALLAFWLAAFGLDAPLAPLLGLSLAIACCMAVGFVALYSYLMDRASPLQAGVDFTLFQCADAMTAALAGAAAGMVAHCLGYGAGIGAAVALALAAAAALPAVARRVAAAESPSPSLSASEVSD